MYNTSFLNFINMKSKEDLSTGILDYLLDYNKRTAFRSILFRTIGITIKDYFTEQQKTIKSIRNGRLDLLIHSNDTMLVIENKFDASFTWSDEEGTQLQKYCNWLSNQKNHTNKYLVIITIPRRKKEVKQYINSELKKYSEIKIIDVYWHDILNPSIEKEKDITVNAIMKELKNFIDINFCKYIAFEEGNKMKELFSTNVGEYFGLIEDMIDKIESLIYGKYSMPNSKRRNRFDQDSGAIGFYYLVNKNKYWFGMNPSVWKEKGSPLCLQLIETNGIEINECDNQKIKSLLDKWYNLGYEGINGEINYVFKIKEIKNEDILFKRIKELTI